MQKNWNILPQDPQARLRLAGELGIASLIAQVLLNREIRTAEQAHAYLYGTLADCGDPFRLKGMAEAVSRIRAGIGTGEAIVIYGDYDADGVTSCALLVRFLKRMGANVSAYIPHRVDEGYGMNRSACAYLARKGTNLVITVDCGISSADEVAYLKAKGVDVIVTDHHQLHGTRVPDAAAVISPLQPQDTYPYKDLAGVGIAYKLAQALSRDSGVSADDYLDLVAVGTICDVAPLTGENRIMVKAGLERLNATENPGLKALKDVAGVGSRTISAYHVGFILGPRINATGRMGSADTALRLLLCDDPRKAVALAQELDSENRQRQKEEAKTLKHALMMIENGDGIEQRTSVVLHHSDWHPGVIGIVASRLTERFYRPTILFAVKDGTGKGSGRSIRNLHLFKALTQCEHLLAGYGGHEKAAGVSIAEANLEEFMSVFDATVAAMINKEDMIPRIDADMEVRLGELTEDDILALERCEPFGMGNPRPVFVSHGVRIKALPRALRGSMFKMWLTDGMVTCEALGSNGTGYKPLAARDVLSICYSPSVNDWQGINTIELRLKDIRKTERNV